LRSDAKLIAKVSQASRKAMPVAPRKNRQLEPLFSAKGLDDSVCVLDVDGLELESEVHEVDVDEKCKEHSNPPAYNGFRNGSSTGLSPEAKKAIQKLEEFAGKICVHDMSSDDLCVLEERVECAERRRQGNALETLVVTTHAKKNGVSRVNALTASPPLREPTGDSAIAPTYMSKSLWPPWCGKTSVQLSEVEIRSPRKRPKAPGLAPNDITESGASGNFCVRGKPDLEKPAQEYESAWDVQSTASSLPSESPLISPQPSPAVAAAFRTMDKEQSSRDSVSSSRSQKQGKDAVPKSHFFDACCKALPSGPSLERASPSRCPPTAVVEDLPLMPCSPRATLEHERRAASDESQIWRRFPLGVSPTSVAQDLKQDVSCAPIDDGVFRRGTKFTI
jgi:hypothetical protein